MVSASCVVQNESWRLPTSGLISASLAPLSSQPLLAVDQRPSTSDSPKKVFTGPVIQQRTFLPAGARLTRAAMLAAAAGRAEPAHASLHQPHSNGRESSHSASSSSSSSGVSALLRSAGSVQAISAPAYLYEALLSSLLPPAAPPGSGSALVAGAEADSRTSSSSVAGGKRPRSVGPDLSDLTPLAAALRIAEAWGVGGIMGHLSPMQRDASSDDAIHNAALPISRPSGSGISSEASVSVGGASSSAVMASLFSSARVFVERSATTNGGKAAVNASLSAAISRVAPPATTSAVDSSAVASLRKSRSSISAVSSAEGTVDTAGQKTKVELAPERRRRQGSVASTALAPPMIGKASSLAGASVADVVLRHSAGVTIASSSVLPSSALPVPPASPSASSLGSVGRHTRARSRAESIALGGGVVAAGSAPSASAAAVAALSNSAGRLSPIFEEGSSKGSRSVAAPGKVAAKLRAKGPG
jgi:hypothetical protein